MTDQQPIWPADAPERREAIALLREVAAIGPECYGFEPLQTRVIGFLRGLEGE